jgi:hypothetical protein
VHRADRRFIIRERILVPLVSTLERSNKLRTVVSDFGAVANFIGRSKVQFPQSIFLGTRKSLLKSVLKCDPNERVVVFEFGVARGALTAWGLRQIKSKNLKWVGYDTFTGLPSDWIRENIVYLQKGAFSTEGRHPEIKDARVSFVVGDVTETFKEIPSLFEPGTLFRSIFIFDLDLFSPSKAVWDVIFPRLRTGDRLFFDQAFDNDGEGKLIEDYLLPSVNVRHLGRSVICAAFEVT